MKKQPNPKCPDPNCGYGTFFLKCFDTKLKMIKSWFLKIMSLFACNAGK